MSLLQLFGFNKNTILQAKHFLMLSMFLLSACGVSESLVPGVVGGTGSNGQSKLYGDIGIESSFCSNISVPVTATRITATAQYRARQVVTSGVYAGLGSPSTFPIRYAEIQILDSNGNIIQCGETGSSGQVAVDIPQTAGTYTLKVLSRAQNSNHVIASILNNPTSMTPYSISTSFSIGAGQTSQAVTLSSATYTDSLEGGAFNILDQIVTANEYLLNNTACAFCSTFPGSVGIQKVRVFWKPGLSPGAYYQSPTSATSFYISTDQTGLGMAAGIYLLGGINGDVCVDTDHFDNSVIIHEYGHFLESKYAYSDSPGGSHSGNSVIDPRLAWSEGWANFVQGAIRNNDHYYDTEGNADCATGTGLNVNLDLETPQVGQDKMSVATYLGEGIFREVSVSRVLWDAMGSNVGGDGYGASLGFPYIWKTFSDTSSGLRSNSVHFRNVGLFNQFLRGYVSANNSSALTDFDNLVTNERQRSDTNEYGRVVTAQAGASCTYAIQGVSGVSNLAKTNDFLAYYYDGTEANATITLKYSATTGGQTPTDLDLYIWQDGYAFSDASTMAGQSARVYPESGSNGVEVVNLSGKATGYYLIQIATDPDSVHGAVTYYLETNSGGSRLCP